MSPRNLVLISTAVTIITSMVSATIMVRYSASSPIDSHQAQLITKKKSLVAQFKKDTAKLPYAKKSGVIPRCTHVGKVVAQGLSCRSRDGLYAMAEAPGMLTHGPDLINLTSGAQNTTAVANASKDSVVCSSTAHTRHVLLLYLLPSDYASGASDVHTDRYAEIAPKMRQAFYDASAMVDQRAEQLQTGTRRRIRVVCDEADQPLVLRIVLPHKAVEYRNADSGFSAFIRDLTKLGLVQQYPDYQQASQRSLLRILAYYDADFVAGVHGQGTLYRKASLLEQGVSANSPLVSTSVRNINNSPPSSSVAIQYGTRYGEGEPDPPEATALLHELSHTMGAVQDEVPTSTLAGHCIDGLDVMCYDDGGRRGALYDPSKCASQDSTTGVSEVTREQYDCNGDTYFNPAPTLGNPLASDFIWQLGLKANQTFDVTSKVLGSAPTVSNVTWRGKGTSIKVSWNLKKGVKVAGFDVLAVPVSLDNYTPQQSTKGSSLEPFLRPFTTYDITVRVVDQTGAVGAAKTIRVRTGKDTSPPLPISSIRLVGQKKGAMRIDWGQAIDNKQVSYYFIERNVGIRWVRVGKVVTDANLSRVRSGWISLPTRTRQSLRVVGVDSGGRVAKNGRVLRVAVP